MTDDAKRFVFLLRQVPFCTLSPVRNLIGAARYKELRAKYKLGLGLDLLEDRCPNSFNCLNVNEGCIGRPFPIDAEIKKALESLNTTVTIGNYKGVDVYLAQATVSCASCPFNGQCESICPTQDSYLNRSTRIESNPPENLLVPYDDYENGVYKALLPEDVEHCEIGDWAEEELPLDCLTQKQRQVIEMTLYEGLDQATIAVRMDSTIPTVSIHLKRGLARLEEFGKARKAIKQSKLIPNVVVDYYQNNLSQKQISLKYNKNQGNISRLLKEWIKLNVK